MKKILAFFVLINSALAGQSQSSNFCVQTYCLDSIWLPINTIALVARVTSTSPIVSRSWNQVSGPNSAILATTPNPDSVIATGLIAGRYIFMYAVSNSQGSNIVARDTVDVIPAPNQPPVAITNKDTSISNPQNVFILDGSRSYDPEGGVLVYIWAGPNIVSASGPFAFAGNLTPGVYNYSLTVKDPIGASSSVSFKLTVNPAPPPRKVIAVNVNAATNMRTATYNDGQTENW